MGQRRRLRQNSRGRNGGRRCIERPKWVRALVVELWRPQTKGEDGPTHRLSSHPLLPLTTLCSLSSLPSSSSLAHFLPHAFRLLTSPSVLQMVSAALVSSADVTPLGGKAAWALAASAQRRSGRRGPAVRACAARGKPSRWARARQCARPWGSRRPRSRRLPLPGAAPPFPRGSPCPRLRHSPSPHHRHSASHPRSAASRRSAVRP